MNIYEWLGQPGGIIGPAIGSVADYTTPGRLQPWEYGHLVQTAINNLAFASDPNARRELILRLHQAGGFPDEDLNTILTYWADPARPAGELADMAQIVGARLAAQPTPVQLPGTPASGGGGTVDPGAGVTDVAPVQVGQSQIPQGARVVIVDNPEGADAPALFNLVYTWRGIELVYEVGDEARFNQLFGGLSQFASINRLSQAGFDNQGFTQVGSVDQILGSTESLGSQIEREVRALGLEDLPSWLANSPQALALVAQATAQEWSTGRLWQELEGTQAFQARFGGAIDRYLQGGATISEAVDRLVADEAGVRAAFRQFQPEGFNLTNEAIHGMLARGWTPPAISQVLGQAQVLRLEPAAFTQANAVLEAAGLPSLDEVEFLNAINGFGVPEVVATLNAAAAGVALREAGIDVDDETIDILLDVVESPDRLLTVDSFNELAQQLSFNMIRFGSEIDFGKLGVTREDLIAGAFGEASPSGKSSGEMLNLLARFERDRRAAGEGFEDASAFQDQRGRLVIQGLAAL